MSDTRVSSMIPKLGLLVSDRQVMLMSLKGVTLGIRIMSEVDNK